MSEYASRVRRIVHSLNPWDYPLGRSHLLDSLD